MFNFLKKIDKKYYILMAIALFSSIGNFISNRTISFLLSTISSTIIIPAFIITFWDDFASIIPSNKPSKIKKTHKLSLVIALYFVLLNPTIFSYYADIPSALTKNYINIEGTITNQAISGRGRRAKQYFEINDTIYFVGAKDFEVLEKNEKYTITMLKNSNFIIDIEKKGN